MRTDDVRQLVTGRDWLALYERLAAAVRARLSAETSRMWAIAQRRFRQRGSGRIATEVAARQGWRGHTILIVLVLSLVLGGLYVVGMTGWAVLESSNSATRNPPAVPSSALNLNDVPAANPAYPVPAVPRVK